MKQRLQQLISVDLRSLALFRMGLGIILICDLINRSRDLKAHYSDWGLLPRAPLIEQFLQKFHISFHLISGRVEIQAVLFLLAGLAAFALLIGYRTRLATFLSWVLLISLHTRNPMVLQGGDTLLRALMFWAMFLPLGARASVDAALNSGDKPSEQNPYLGIGSLALLLQICMVYWFTALLKMHPIWHTEGTAIYYALSLDQFTTPFGRYLLNFPKLLQMMTIITLYWEGLGPFLLFLPWKNSWFRTFCIAGFILLHLGFIFTLELGLFPYISIIGWIGLLPSGFWDGLEKRWWRKHDNQLKIFYDGDCGFCKKTAFLLRSFFWLDFVPTQTAQSDPKIFQAMQARNSWVVVDGTGQQRFSFAALCYVLRQSFWGAPWGYLGGLPGVRWLGEKTYAWVANHRGLSSWLLRPLKWRPYRWHLGVILQMFATFCLVYVIFWNVRALNFNRYVKYFPRYWNGIANVLRIDQYWDMFAPYPLKDDGWYVIPGQLRNGEEVDLFRGGASVSWERPELISATYPSQRWRKYMMNLWKKKNKDHRLYFGRYLCREWNSRHKGEETLETFQIYFMLEKTLPPGQPTTIQKTKIWDHDCFKKPEKN